MKIMYIKHFLFYPLILVGFLSPVKPSGGESKQGSAENVIYLCFKYDNEFIEVEELPGSSITTFKIMRKGYDTTEERRRAMHEFVDREKRIAPLLALFFFEFYSAMYPDKQSVHSIKEVNCRTPEELRKGNFAIEGDSQLVFIQEHSDGKACIWKNVKHRNRI